VTLPVGITSLHGGHGRYWRYSGGSHRMRAPFEFLIHPSLSRECDRCRLLNFRATEGSDPGFKEGGGVVEGPPPPLLSLTSLPSTTPPPSLNPGSLPSVALKFSNLHRSHSLESDGWIKNSNGDLILWLPPEYRQYLPWPPCRLVIPTGKVTVDLGDFVHGPAWTKCYEPSTPA